MRLNGRLDEIERLVREKRASSHGWRTAVQFDDGPAYLLPEGQFSEAYATEEACIVAGLETVDEDDPRDVIIFNFVPAVVNARGKPVDQVEKEIADARALWGDGPRDILIIDR